MPLFIGETACPSSQCPEGWIWLKPIEGGLEVYSFTNRAWVLEKTIALTSHSHADLSGEFEGTFKKIKIENGIVTEFELV